MKAFVGECAGYGGKMDGWIVYNFEFAIFPRRKKNDKENKKKKELDLTLPPRHALTFRHLPIRP